MEYTLLKDSLKYYIQKNQKRHWILPGDPLQVAAALQTPSAFLALSLAFGDWFYKTKTPFIFTRIVLWLFLDMCLCSSFCCTMKCSPLVWLRALERTLSEIITSSRSRAINKFLSGSSTSRKWWEVVGHTEEELFLTKVLFPFQYAFNLLCMPRGIDGGFDCPFISLIWLVSFCVFETRNLLFALSFVL